MLDDHDEVDEITLFMLVEAFRCMIEHNLVSGYYDRGKAIPQSCCTFIELVLNSSPNPLGDMTFIY